MSITQVHEFMKKSGQTISNNILEINDENIDLWQLRADLILEEAHELQEAIDNRDLTEAIDALGDISYVLDGAFLSTGIDKKTVVDEVHRSNMTKFPLTEDIAEQSVNFYSKQGRNCHYENKGGYFVIKDSTTSKILKSIEWNEPNFKRLLNE